MLRNNAISIIQTFLDAILFSSTSSDWFQALLGSTESALKEYSCI